MLPNIVLKKCDLKSFQFLDEIGYEFEHNDDSYVFYNNKIKVVITVERDVSFYVVYLNLIPRNKDIAIDFSFRPDEMKYLLGVMGAASDLYFFQCISKESIINACDKLAELLKVYFDKLLKDGEDYSVFDVALLEFKKDLLHERNKRKITSFNEQLFRELDEAYSIKNYFLYLKIANELKDNLGAFDKKKVVIIRKKVALI